MTRAPLRSCASSFSRAAIRRGATPETDGSSADGVPVPSLGVEDAGLPPNRSKNPMYASKATGAHVANRIAGSVQHVSTLGHGEFRRANRESIHPIDRLFQ